MTALMAAGSSGAGAAACAGAALAAGEPIANSAGPAVVNERRDQWQKTVRVGGALYRVQKNPGA
jgi:hypothetical protein